MRKITSLIALTLIASFAMAQVQLSLRTMKSTPQDFEGKRHIAPSNLKGGTIFWSEDFQGEENWTKGNLEGTKQWHVTGLADVPDAFEVLESGGSYFFPLGHEISETNFGIEFDPDRKWAWIDGISDLLPGGPGGQILDSYIQFDGIDLSDSDQPKLTFLQIYKPLNQAYSYVDISVDGGDNWTEIQVNEGVAGNDYGDAIYELYLGSIAANESDVSIRFRWQTTANNINGYGYGWQIDEIKIIENPLYDVRLLETRTNFIDYIDYSVPGQADYYHISGHYGQIPQAQYESPYMICVFNASIENNGVETVRPGLEVIVLDPEENEVYNQTVLGARDIAITERDTVDLIEIELALGSDPMIGEYKIIFNAFIDGATDEFPENNTDTANFFVTENVMSRDAKRVTGSGGPGQWMTGGNDGDMLGTSYLFLFEEEITHMSVYIDARTTPGTALIGRVLTPDGQDYVDLTSSTLINIEEEHIGEWLDIEFIAPLHLDFGGEDAMSLLAAIEFYYNDPDNALFIGVDRSNQQSIWASSWYFTEGQNAGQWFSLQGYQAGPAIRLHTPSDDDPDPNSILTNEANDINIYPNPTTADLNIENVQGASIQILNLMGQVVESIENANEFNTVNMSQHANGTYIVRIIKDNNVTTQKINLVD